MADRSRFGRTHLYPAVRFPVQCTTGLIDMTLPVPSLTRPPGFLRALVAHSEATASAYGVVGVGPGTGPEDLSFAALRDASAYHFNVQGPLSLEIAEASAEAAGVAIGSDPSWQPQDWHPDHLQLIRELGQDPAN